MSNLLEESCRLFIEALIRTPDNTEPLDAIKARLSESTKERFTVYEDNFLGGLIDVATDVIFYEVCDLFGREAVTEIVAAYFYQHPPRTQVIDAIAEPIPTFVRELDTELGPMMADLMTYCIARRRVLVGEDPEDQPPPILTATEDLGRLKLRSNHRLIVSDGPIYDLHQAALRKLECELEIPDKPQAVLLLKSAYNRVETLLVPPEALELTKMLSSGQDVATAIDLVPELEATIFHDWLKTLTKVQALVG